MHGQFASESLKHCNCTLKQYSVRRVISDWPEMTEKMTWWAEWRSAMMRPGGQSVMTSGPLRMPWLPVDSLGSMIKVCKVRFVSYRLYQALMK